MKLKSKYIILLLVFIPVYSYSQVQLGVWRTPDNNTMYHHFTRDGTGAAVYINQLQENSSHPILRLSSGTLEPNQNVKFTVESNGYVGIGTENPLTNLEIKSTGTIGSKWDVEKAYFRIYDGVSSLIFDNNEIYSDTNLHIGISTNGYFKFRTVSATGVNDLMYIGSDGNVGIGFSKPTHKLTVDGIISASEVRVSNTPNSDYVFEPNYNLLPLYEVETFIKENKHLPDVPSAEEFKENGVGLGEMDDMLLRKVEELTLYVIQQQKELEALKEENQNQNVLIKKQQERIEFLSSKEK